MVDSSEVTRRGMLRALVISLAALVIPVVGAFVVPETQSEYEALLWLLALIPAFLLSYHRGWRGVATSLALGMAVLSVTYAVTQSLGRALPDLLFAVVAFYILIALMVGWLTERLNTDAVRDAIEGDAYTDEVTGLPNRRHGELHLDIEFNAAQRGRPVSVVLLDIDRFKAYVAQHGSAVGDEMIQLIATALKRNTRRMNLVARYSPDEFLAVLGDADADGALVFVTRFQQSLRQLAGQLPVPMVSAGVATFDASMQAGADLIGAAQQALERAKNEGTGRVRVHGRLQVAQVELPESAVVSAPGRSRPEGRPGSRKALVVVGEEAVRGLLVRYLTDHGFAVAQVANAADGVQCLAIEYDLLVTDISLAEGSGGELVRAAKTRWPTIQVLGLAHLDGGTTIEALNAGVDRFIAKPLELARLRQHLSELLARRDRLVASVLENRQQTLEIQAERAEALEALRRREEEYRSVVESLHEIIFRLDHTGAFSFLNWAWTAMTGYPVDDTMGKPALSFLHGSQRADFEAMLGALMRGELEEARAELRLIASDGGTRWVELSARRTFDASGTVNGASGTLNNITRRKDTEEQLRRSEEAGRALLAALPDEVFGLSRQGVFLNYEDGKGNGRPSPVGKALEEVFPDEVAKRYRHCIERLVATREVQVCEYRLEDDDGAQQYEARLALSGDDEVVAIVRNTSEQRRLEEQLRQSQKLEAIGRLAGGLAHDFNNLLTVVQGNAHLIIEESGENDSVREFALQIDSAAGRGADLVRQLLAFGRRQVMQPRLLSLNSVLNSVHAMLPRLLGEDVILEMDLDSDLGLVKADPGQMEHVIVSLAAFAKARMPNGGKLKIRTRNAVAGQDYDPQLISLDADELVLLTMNDSGTALDENTRAHIFEPFFGKSASQTGLRLASVYGIVTQSGGAIMLDDEPNGGARFQIFLPRVDTT
ncbi:MAG TPA: diguanylate cyclase [Longimicrobiales bacterium]|nr:diguanylate cyclase [Longimicrobiales bacterium]